MIVNPDKFQAMIINKTKRYHSNETLEFNPNKAGLFQGSFDCPQPLHSLPTLHISKRTYLISI